MWSIFLSIYRTEITHTHMQFTLMDPHVDPTMNVFLVMANVLNLVYNLPQVLQTYRTKSTHDINHWFITLRIVGNCIWIAYAIRINSFFLLLNNSVTVVSSLIIGYYKCLSLIHI